MKRTDIGFGLLLGLLIVAPWAAASGEPAPLTRYTRVFNLTGLPAISVPCGFSSGGLPIGLQLVGRAWDEATVLRAACAYEMATEWTERPSLEEFGNEEHISATCGDTRTTPGARQAH